MQQQTESPTERTGPIVNRHDLGVLGLVASAGVFGGCLSILLETATGGEPIVGVGGAGLLGIVAAVFFVFVVSNTERTDRLRLIAVAVAAGLFWNPVIEGAQAWIEQGHDERTPSETEDDAEKIQPLLNEYEDANDEREKEAIANEISATIDRIDRRMTRINSRRTVENLEETIRPRLESLTRSSELPEDVKEKARALDFTATRQDLSAVPRGDSLTLFDPDSLADLDRDIGRLSDQISTLPTLNELEAVRAERDAYHNPLTGDIRGARTSINRFIDAASQNQINEVAFAERAQLFIDALANSQQPELIRFANARAISALGRPIISDSDASLSNPKCLESMMPLLDSTKSITPSRGGG